MTTAACSRRLSISKQAVAKHIDSLERLGYLTREPDPDDARSKIVRLTERGTDCLAQSARIFDELRQRWADTLGAHRLRAIEADLRKVTGPDHFPLDVPGWFGNQWVARVSQPRQPASPAYQ